MSLHFVAGNVERNRNSVRASIRSGTTPHDWNLLAVIVDRRLRYHNHPSPGLHLHKPHLPGSGEKSAIAVVAEDVALWDALLLQLCLHSDHADVSPGPAEEHGDSLALLLLLPLPPPHGNATLHMEPLKPCL
ncbi:hypothetical protein U1Q18_030722 [Sarracenia purpurea var. burkii]